MARIRSAALPGGSPFYSHPARVLGEYLAAWQAAVRTLPDDQLAREYSELCGQSRDREPVPANMLVEVYGAELDRRSRANASLGVAIPPTSCPCRDACGTPR